MSEASKTASGFLYLNAGITGLSGLVSLIKGPRLSGLVKLAGSGAQVWAATEPSTQRLQIAAAASAGVGVADALGALSPRISGAQRVFRLSGAVFNALLAVLHNEASHDL